VESSARPVVAIIPAAGSGARLGSALPKALVAVGGTPIVRRTVDTLVAVGRFLRIVVAVPPAHRRQFEHALDGVAGLTLVAGGAERQASVRAGIDYVERELPEVIDHGSILVHDAARCLLSHDLVNRCLEKHAHARAVTAAMPVVDTLVRADTSGVVQDAIDRAAVYAIQTPQIFEGRLLRDAHARGIVGATDDASLVAPLEAVHVVIGDRLNIKITTPDDLVLGEVLAKIGMNSEGMKR
jgi:2-C-methyl-D-erythritol 4-phosphate cytidylyltransferase